MNLYSGNATNISSECTTVDPTLGPTPFPTPVPTPFCEPCQECTSSPTQYPIFPDCEPEIALDIAILIDESGSINDEEYSVMIRILNRLINDDINQISYLSLFRFADISDFHQIIDFTLLDPNGRQLVSNSLENHIRETGETFTGYAIQQTLEYFDKNNQRSDLLLIFTDGVSHDNVCDIVTPSNIENVEIVLIGIGDDLDLSILTSDNYNCLYDSINDDVFYIPSFTEEAFIDKEEELRLKTCREDVSSASSVFALDGLSEMESTNTRRDKLYFTLIAVFVIMVISINLNFCLCLIIYKTSAYNKYQLVNNEKDQNEEV